MFLYFLQKKEFLAGDRRFLTTQYQASRRDDDEFEYYSNVLEILFFDTLNKQRPNFDSQWDKIPYLNGGLFDRDYGPDIRDTAGRETPQAIALPNSLFNPGNTESILAYFNGYNFTVSENVAGDEDIAVDPEMLGKVFENMLAAEERGKSGTFYTPRGIVHFMCSEVLARYLADETDMKLEDVQKLIDYDPDVTDAETKELISPQQAKALKKAIEEIKVLDPAVGSGAFPLGMMQIILNVRQAVARREGMTIQRGSLTISQWKREIIANNLYGVDIKPEAIEIAKLRMWLSLVVDIPKIEDVEPLPNLDYKLMCGDSLISTIHGEQLIPDPNKDKLQLEINVTPIQKAIQPLLDLQHRYFDAQTEERHDLRKQILEAEAEVFRVAVGDRRDYWLGKQAELEQKIKMMKGKVSNAQVKQRAEITAKLAELKKFSQEVESGDRSLNFFQYHLHFRDVFDKKGGFDCVIGNPPYKIIGRDQLEEQELFKTLFSFIQYKINTYLLFLEKGLLLLKSNNSQLGFIIPKSLAFNTYFEKARKELLSKYKIPKIIEIPEGIFENAVVGDNIIIFACISDNPLENTLNYYKVDNIEMINSTPKKAYLEKQKELIKLPQIKFYKSNLVSTNNVSIQLLDNICTISNGLNPGNVRHILLSNCKETENHQKMVLGKDICNYSLEWSGTWVNYNPLLKNVLTTDDIKSKKGMTAQKKVDFALRDAKIYDPHKILVRKTSDHVIATYDDQGFYFDSLTYSVQLDKDKEIEFSLKYILGLLNSKLINYLYQNISDNKGKIFAKVLKSHLVKLPIADISLKNQQPIIKLVNDILEIKAKNAKADISKIEEQIDKKVYQLYSLTEEEIIIVQNST